MSFFEIVNEDLFKPLTWSDKRRYMDILSLLWDTCRRKPMYAISKTEMIDIVEDYLIGYGEGIAIDEEADDDVPDTNDYRGLATFFLRKLRQSGWLIEREGEYEEENRLALDHHIIPVLRSFAEVINPKIITYKGKLFEIYSMFSRIKEIENPYETCLKVAEENLIELNLSLHQLAASIEDHIDELTAGKRPEDILAFFEEYEEHIVVGSYQRFKTNDNLFYYRTTLHEKIDECEDELIETLIKDYMETERVAEIEARLSIQKLLQSMRDSLVEMEEIMRVIDDQHILYRTRAVQRAQFLLLSDGSTKSKLSGLLKYYAQTVREKDDLAAVDNTPVHDVFQVFGQNYFDSGSLATPSKRRKPTPITQMASVDDLDLEYIEAQQRALFEYARSALTSENVNRYAGELLGAEKSVSASYILEKDPAAIVKIIGLYTYSMSSDRVYNVSLKDSYVTVGGIKFRDFVIEKGV